MACILHVIASLCCAALQFFFSSPSVSMRAVHVTVDSCSLVSSEFAVAVALPIESFPPRFFLGWPKHSSENHGKSDFWRQNFDERDRRICNEKAVLANDVIVRDYVSKQSFQ